MGLKKTAVLAILMAIFVCGIFAAPLNKGAEKGEDCTELEKVFSNLFNKILSSKKSNLFVFVWLEVKYHKYGN